MVINFAGTKRHLQMLYSDKCDIETALDVIDPYTKLTTSEYRVKYTDIPCYLSYRKLLTADNNFSGDITQIIVLFLDNQYEIPPGSKIKIRKAGQSNKVIEYRLSSAPAIYQNHQEIALELAQSVV